jgi:subtilisin family serine protease
VSTPSWGRVTGAILAVVGIVFAVIAPPASAGLSSRRQEQWYLDVLNIPRAQRITNGSGVVVAVIDDMGIDARIPELRGKVLQGAGFGGSPNGIYYGADHTHATSVASIIAGSGGGPDQILGVAPGVKILPVGLKLHLEGTNYRCSSPEDIANAIRWAADHGAKVINMSLGAAVGDLMPQPIIDAVHYALSKDVVLVASAGNVVQGQLSVAAPAGIPGVIAVSGTVRQNAGFWDGSAKGNAVVLGAPAKDIVTAASGGPPWRHLITSGTSDASPIVAGTAALIRSKYPQMNAVNVINRLIKTAKDQGPPGRDPYYGFGTVRPLDALTAHVSDVSSNPLIYNGGVTAPTTAGKRTSGGVAGLPYWAWAAIGCAMLVVVVLVIGSSARRRRGGPGVAAPAPGGPGYQPPWGQVPPGASPGPAGPPPPQDWQPGIPPASPRPMGSQSFRPPPIDPRSS